jgi:integrase
MPSITDWEAELRLSCTPRTVRAYTGAIRTLLEHAGKTRPDHLDRGDVVAWLGQPHLTSNTRAVYLRRVRAWAAWADRPDLVDGVKAAPYRHPPVRTLTDAEVTAMFAACQGVEDEALLILLGWLGLRRCEAAAVSGADFTDMHLTVRGKGGRVDRVPIDSAVRQAAGRMPGGYWFPSGAGHVSGQAVAGRVGRIGRDAGLGHVTPHMLRRWMATSMSRGGAPLASISLLLRHRSVSTTMIYVTPDERDLRAARAVLPRVWAA